MKAKIRGTEIYFDIAGSHLIAKNNQLVEQPVLFLLHGGPGGDHTRYKQTSSTLQEVAQLVFIDHRGCGRSKKTQASHYTLENNIEDIEALRKHLGLERICLLGTSYGGMVAQGYAIRYPQNVAKLILVVTAPSYHFLDEAKQILEKRGTPEQIKIAKNLWGGTFKNGNHVAKFIQTMQTLYSTTAQKKPNKPLFSVQQQWSHEALNQGFSNYLRKFNFIPHLKNITCPTLILAGNDDWICPPSQSKVIAKHIKQAKLKIFKNCGHSLSVDANQQYLRTIKSFMREKNAKAKK